MRMEIEELKGVWRMEEESQVQGMVARLRWQGLEEGERPTKYLSRLLRARRVKQRWEKIIKGDDGSVTGVQGILGELKSHWGKLWSEEEGGADSEAIAKCLEDWCPPEVEGLGELMRPVREEEILQVLAATKSGTAPGEDGLPWDFWKRMVKVEEVCKEMRDMCDEVIESGSWLGGQKLGLVVLLYKDKR